jgi:hypothetical protein
MFAFVMSSGYHPLNKFEDYDTLLGGAGQELKNLSRIKADWKQRTN